MIAAIRLWLLGVEPDGPPLLADPLYRYEARRYWTWKRYLWTALLLLLWLAGVCAYFHDLTRWAMFRGNLSVEETARLAVMFALFGRAPLSFVASTGAALCIVPEKVSGQLEQFILTPVDSWRFCLARLAGRLKGLYHFWMAMAWVTCAALPLAVGLFGRAAGVTELGPVLVALLVGVAVQVDLAAMLTVDAAVGMRFTATCRSTPAALIKTYLTNFVLTPISMWIGAAAAFGAGMVVSQRILGMGSPWLGSPTTLTCGFLLAVLVRLGLGALAVRVALRDARNAIGKTFYQPEG